jgi:hypothetical protein
VLKSDKESDYTFIKQKIYMTNIMKVVRLVMQILFVSFFMGQYWYIFSQTVHEFKFNEPEATSLDFEFDENEEEETTYIY